MRCRSALGLEDPLRCGDLLKPAHGAWASLNIRSEALAFTLRSGDKGPGVCFELPLQRCWLEHLYPCQPHRVTRASPKLGDLYRRRDLYQREGVGLDRVQVTLQHASVGSNCC